MLIKKRGKAQENQGLTELSTISTYPTTTTPTNIIKHSLYSSTDRSGRKEKYEIHSF